MEYQKLHKNALKVMYISEIITAIICWIIISMLCANVDITGIWELIILVLQIFIGVKLIIFPRYRYIRYKYAISEDKIDVVEGVFTIKRTIVPIERMHKITWSRGPINSMFGLTRVNVTTAGGEACINFLEIDVAEAISESLKNKINEVVIEEKLESIKQSEVEEIRVEAKVLDNIADDATIKEV